MLSDKLRADGGTTTKEIGGESEPLDAAEHDECDCDDVPCADCYIEGRKELLE